VGYRRALKTGRKGLGSREPINWRPELRIPAAEDVLKLIVEHAGAALQEEVGAALRPLHLLALHHPFADHLVDRGFHEGGRDCLALSEALALVRDEVAVGVISPNPRKFRQPTLATAAIASSPGAVREIGRSIAPEVVEAV
jgi:hypothetical protein